MKNFKNTKTNLMAAVIGLLIAPMLLVGCNTVEGAGTDIRHAGSAIENSAERNK